MKVEDFIDKAIEEYGVEWKFGKHNGKDGYFIRCEKFGTIIHATRKSIEDNPWGVLNGQITQGKNVYQITRIVGYYSRIENWNKSKLGELKDRQKGQYKL